MKMKKEGDVAMDYIKAFIVGGIICAITQVLMEKTKLMPGRIMVILVTSGIVLGACGYMNLLKNMPAVVPVFRLPGLAMFCGRA